MPTPPLGILLVTAPTLHLIQFLCSFEEQQLGGHHPQLLWASGAREQSLQVRHQSASQTNLDLSIEAVPLPRPWAGMWLAITLVLSPQGAPQSLTLTELLTSSLRENRGPQGMLPRPREWKAISLHLPRARRGPPSPSSPVYLPELVSEVQGLPCFPEPRWISSLQEKHCLLFTAQPLAQFTKLQLDF